jgi:hypothetical protein
MGANPRKSRFMKKIIWLPVLAIGLFLALVCGCNKNNQPPVSRTALLTGATWKFDTAGIDLNMDGTVDFADTTIQPCQKNNTYSFKSDSTGTMDEGATKCNSTDPQTVGFHWAFNASQTVINATIPGLNGSANIFVLNSNIMTLYRDSVVLGQSIRYIFTLKH